MLVRTILSRTILSRTILAATLAGVNAATSGALAQPTQAQPAQVVPKASPAQTSAEASPTTDMDTPLVLEAAVSFGGARVRNATFSTGTDSPTPRHLSDLGKRGVLYGGIGVGAAIRLEEVGLEIGGAVDVLLSQQLRAYGRPDRPQERHRVKLSRQTLVLAGPQLAWAPGDHGLYLSGRLGLGVAEELGVGAHLEAGYRIPFGSDTGLRIGLVGSGIWTTLEEEGDSSTYDYNNRWLAAQVRVTFFWRRSREEAGF